MQRRKLTVLQKVGEILPKKNAAEFYWDEKKKLYRKRVKDETSGKWVDVYGKTKAETRRRAEEKQFALAAKKQREDMPFLFQYAQTWYELNSPSVSDKQKQTFRTAINKHICPVIGNKYLCDITTDDAQAVMAACADLSHESQTKILSIMRRIFKAAVARGYMAASPAKELKAGGARTQEKKPLTRAQQKTLIDSLAGHRCQLFCAIALWAGLRREEVLGLKWSCVHLDETVPYISVRYACHWTHNAPIVNEKLKSAAAKRDIPIPPQLVELLREAEKDSVGEMVIADANGKAMSRGSFLRMWNAIEMRSVREFHYKTNGKEYSRQLKLGDRAPYTGTTVAIDFPVQPHQLRHTYITELIIAGANIKTVQYLAGHSDIKITLQIYTHLTDNLPQSTQGAVLAAFGGQSTEGNASG